MKYSKISIHKLKTNPRNPRLIKDKKFKELKADIQRLPSMMNSRPIIVDEKYIILGGNQRHKACKSLGWKRIPFDRFTPDKADEMNAIAKEENRDEFTYAEYCDMIIIADNVSHGEWDTDIIATYWSRETMENYGANIPLWKQEFEDPEVVFSEYMDEAQNYIVLTFDNEIDWLSAQTHFDLKSVYSKRANGKKWSKGIGRVLNGADYLKDLKDQDEKEDTSKFIEIE